MSNEERIDAIESFLHQQRDLHGLRFQITEEEENFVIEFEKASERQVWTLRHALNKSMMHHILVRAHEIVKYDKPKQKFKKRKHGQ